MFGLAEVGRKISKKNAARLRAAMKEIGELLSLVEDGEAKEAALTEAERQWREREDLVRKAIRAAVEQPDPDHYCCYTWVEAMFDTEVVYSVRDKLLRCTYSIADDGAVTLGNPAEVIRRTSYDPAPAAPVAAAEKFVAIGDEVPLQEAGGALTEAAAELVEGAALIKLISPGWGTSGYYSPEMLKQYGPTAWPKGTHMFINHATAEERAKRPERDVKDLAAVLESDARWIQNGPRGPALYADARYGTNYAPLIKEFSKDIGVSIYATGERVAGEAAGQKGLIVTKLDPATANPHNSVDFVTRAGRGGEIVSLFEAAGRGPVAIPTRKDQTKMTKEEIQALITESQQPFVARIAAAEAKVTATEADNARLREALALQGARAFVEARLKPLNLPDLTKQRLVESLQMRAVVKDGALDTAAFTAVIDAEAVREAEYLGHFIPAVRGAGTPATPPDPKDTAVEEAEADKLLGGALAKLGELSEAGVKRALQGHEVAA